MTSTLYSHRRLRNVTPPPPPPIKIPFVLAYSTCTCMYLRFLLYFECHTPEHYALYIVVIFWCLVYKFLSIPNISKHAWGVCMMVNRTFQILSQSLSAATVFRCPIKSLHTIHRGSVRMGPTCRM